MKSPSRPTQPTTLPVINEKPNGTLSDLVRFRREPRDTYYALSKNEQGAFAQRLRDLLATTLPQATAHADTQGLPIELVDAIHVHESNRYLVSRLRYRVIGETLELIVVELITLSAEVYETYVAQFNEEKADHRLTYAQPATAVSSAN